MTTAKGQVSLEFIYATSAAILISAIVMVAMSSELSDLRNQKENFLVNEIATATRLEFFLAAESHDGYQRTFTIPHNLSGTNYNMTHTNNSVRFQTGYYDNTINVPQTVGILTKGTNQIKKNGGIIYLN